MSEDKPCPVTAMTRLLGTRWTLQLIHHLRQPRRFCELQARVKGITPTMLSRRLHMLEAEGLIARCEPASRNSAYRLTPRGEALLPILDQLSEWSQQHLLNAQQATQTESKSTS